MNNNRYYVYVWRIKDTNEVFYVGKGSGKRYKTLNGRTKLFLDVYNTHDCYVQIAYNNLDEETAYKTEYILVQYFKKKGHLTNQTNGGDGSRFEMYTPEFRLQISKQRRQPDSVYQSKEFKLKCSKSGSDNPNYGHHWTTEMKEKLRIKQIESKRYVGSKNPNSKRIKCLETGEIFECILDAQKKYNVKSPASFWYALNLPNRTAAKLHWDYVS